MSVGARGIHLLIWLCVFTVLCIVFISLRFWAAAKAGRKLYLDDGLVVLALANTMALEGVVIWAIFNGLGKHTNELKPYEFEIQLKLIFASGITWLLGTVLVKLSVLWLYTRIFITKTFKRRAYIMMGVVGCYGVAFVILFMTRCDPIYQQWNPQPGGSCRDLVVQELPSVSLNVIIDIIIVFMPLPVLWSLQLALRSKLVVSIIFSIGLVTIGVMAWRLQFTITIIHDTDFAFDLYNIGLISLLELWLGVIAACIPTLGPLRKAYVKPVITKLTRRSDRNTHGHSATAGSKVNGKVAKYSKKHYSRIEDGSSNRNFHQMNGAVELGSVTTNIKSDPRANVVKDSRAVIYVQYDIEAQYEVNTK